MVVAFHADMTYSNEDTDTPSDFAPSSAEMLAALDAAEDDLHPRVERPEAERPESPIGVVMPGDVGGFVALVARKLGFGDRQVYDDRMENAVRELQHENGLEDDGIVAGQTWAYLLGRLEPGDAGHEVNILRALLGVSAGQGFNEEVELALLGRGFEDSSYVDSLVWAVLIIEAS